MTDTLARQRQLIGTTAQWAANNIVLGNGEIAHERPVSGPVRFKVGDGTSTWSALAYAGPDFSNVPLGSAAAPGLAFVGDSNTGIYSPGADQLAIATNGVQRWSVDAAGVVSIANVLALALGTAALPSHTFTGDPNTGIYSPGADQLAIATNGAQRWSVNATGNVTINSPTSGIALLVNAVSGAPALQTSDGTTAIQIIPDGAAGYRMRVATNHDLNIGTNSLTRLTITAAGNVQIGTAAIGTYKNEITFAGDVVNGVLINDTAAAGVPVIFAVQKNSAPKLSITATDMTWTVNTAAPALGVNQQMVFALTSNTNLRVSVRGTDGTTRVANLTLA